MCEDKVCESSGPVKSEEIEQKQTKETKSWKNDYIMRDY